MSEPRHRKLAAMGMASLVSTGRHEVLDRLPTEICNLWLDVLCEIREAHQSAESGNEYGSRFFSHALWNTDVYYYERRSYPTLHLYWDRVPESFYRETEGMPEYKRRDTVRKMPTSLSCPSHSCLVLPNRPCTNNTAHCVYQRMPGAG